MYLSEGLVCIGIYYVMFLIMFIGFVAFKAYDFYKRFRSNIISKVVQEEKYE